MATNASDKKIKIATLAIALITIATFVWSANVIYNRNFRVSKTPGISTSKLIAKGDLFDGVITNIRNVSNVKFGTKFLGVGVYDRNCVQVGETSTGNPLINCHAGIKTEEYGLLDFNHVHDYNKKPCIVAEEEVVVRIIDRKGRAKVQRVSTLSKKSVQEKGEMTN